MSEKSLLYSHLPYLAAAEAQPVAILPPQALLNSWLTLPPDGSPQTELAALDMALACLFEQLEEYFIGNAFANRLAAAAELLVAAKQEAENLPVQQLVAQLKEALEAADAACREIALRAAEEPAPLC